MNLPIDHDVLNKQAIRDKLALDMAAFLSAGGEAKYFEPHEYKTAERSELGYGRTSQEDIDERRKRGINKMNRKLKNNSGLFGGSNASQ